MLVANKYEFPTKCPEDCAGKDKQFYQGCICSRCPVFLCPPDDDYGSMVEPGRYREDWAAEFHEFVVNGGEEPKLEVK